MSVVKCCLTVYFEDPFWVGVYERSEKGSLEAARVVFGPEPKDYDVYDYFLKNWHRLRFSPSVGLEKQESRRISPKREQRSIQRRLSEPGIGTKAQQALQLQREAIKLERRSVLRGKTEEEKQRRFDLRQLRKKERHKGR